MKEYLSFSESYLDRLISSKVAVKDKQDKIVKIANYNLNLQNEIEKARPSLLNEMKKH